MSVRKTLEAVGITLKPEWTPAGEGGEKEAVFAVPIQRVVVIRRPTSTRIDSLLVTTSAVHPRPDGRVHGDGGAACHTLKAANAIGTVGPDLNKALPGKDAAFIHTSIVDPNAYIAPGYSKGIMPATFGTQLSSKQIDDLVAFVYQSTRG